jgi:hypothetical protein
VRHAPKDNPSPAAWGGGGGWIKVRAA